MATVESDGKMFEPEYQNMDCPKCLQRKVYFDRAIGFYCMSCGHELTNEEVLMLVEKATFASQLTPTSGKGGEKPLRFTITDRRLPISKSRIANRKCTVKVLAVCFSAPASGGNR